MSTTYISQYTASYDLSPLLAFVSNFQLLVYIKKELLMVHLLNFIELNGTLERASESLV